MLGIADPEKQFFILQKAVPFRQTLEITDEGFLLGVGTRLSGPGPGLDHVRILALLASAYGQSLSPSLLTPIEKAAHLWQRGEKCLAQLHLCFTGLPPLTGPQAFALHAADALLHDGLAPRDLLKGLGLDPSPLHQLAKYNPNHRSAGAHGGEFTTADASGAGAPSARTGERQYAQASDPPPPLKRLHPDSTYERDQRAKGSLEYWRKQSTEDILSSFNTKDEELKVKPDGTIMQGNTRVKVLEERGFEVNSIPRVPYGSSFSTGGRLNVDPLLSPGGGTRLPIFPDEE